MCEAVVSMIECVVQDGLRERKKATTRASIVDAADSLFLAQGFENVSLEQVADACVISVRTVLRYFDTKEALALSHEYAFLEQFRSGLSKREGSVLEYWRTYVDTVAADVATRIDWYRQRVEALRPLPLWLRVTGMQREQQMLLAEALAAEAGASNSLWPHLLAAALVTANERVVRFASSGGAFDPIWCVAAVDYITALFSNGPAYDLPRWKAMGCCRGSPCYAVAGSIGSSSPSGSALSSPARYSCQTLSRP